MSKDAKQKPEIDWIAIEREYRAGIKSVRALASEFGVTEGAIRKRARKDDWQRDLAPKIRAKADDLVRTATVRSVVRTENAISERVLVEVNAQVQTDIILSHRKDIQRARKVTMSLLSELEHQTDNLDLYDQLAELLLAPDEKGVDKRNELFNKVISLSGRSSTMKTLADSLKSLIALEREAFGVDQKENGSENGVEAVLKRIALADGQQ
jgi:transposase-like protein